MKKRELIDHWAKEGYECEIEGNLPASKAQFAQFFDPKRLDRIAFVLSGEDWVECDPLIDEQELEELNRLARQLAAAEAMNEAQEGAA